MSRPSLQKVTTVYDAALINVAVLTVIFSIVICIIIPQYVDYIHIILNPLQTIVSWCLIFGIWSTVMLYWLKIQYSKSNSNTKFNIPYKQLSLKVFFYIVSIIVVHIILILFGAPFLSATNETVHLAMLMTTLGIVPPLGVLGTSSGCWLRVYLMHSPNLGLETLVYACTAGTVIGTWIGAIPIPLDWDRPWQQWPISCSIGAMIGHVVGIAFASIYDTYKANQEYNKYKLG